MLEKSNSVWKWELVISLKYCFVMIIAIIFLQVLYFHIFSYGQIFSICMSFTIFDLSFSHHFEALQERTDSGRDRLLYTHRLLPGVTQVDNYGLHLAQVLAFPESILDNAKQLAQKLSSQRKVKHGSHNCLYCNKWSHGQLTGGGHPGWECLLSCSSELSSHLLSENVKIHNFTCSFVWVWNFASHVNRRTHIEGVFQDSMLREYADTRGTKLRGEGGEICIMRSSIIYTFHQILLRWWHQGGWDGWSM
jgi:hypothetical protein